MLLPDNINPENTIYYNGSFVIKELKKSPVQKIVDLYQNVKQQQNSMSFFIFLLCLDWLYLIGVAKLNTIGEIELCSLNH